MTKSNGKNLQDKVLTSFISNFTPEAEVLYARYPSHLTAQQKDQVNLPDVIIHDTRRGVILFVDLITSRGAITEERRQALKILASNLNFEVVYVTAFSSRDEFTEYADVVAWETEVWIAETPKHMIHFNGDRFLGPRK